MTQPADARLAGRAVLVTGAASGIGAAVCRRLVDEGASVAAVDRSSDGLDELWSSTSAVKPFACDVTDEAEVESAVGDAVGELGALHGVAHCAGVFPVEDQVPVHAAELTAFCRTVEVNLTGTFLVLKHALPVLVRTGSSLVTISSVAALRQGGGVGYAASKGGVISLTRAVAAQYGREGVRANTICPGGVDTPMTADLFADEGVRRHVERSTPLGRVASADELAAVVTFLLSDDSSYMSGETLVVDGGGSVV